MTILLSKRVSIVSLSLVKESSLLYGPRRCQTSDDAYALIGHNHPSGDPTPSLADDDLTEKLYKASELLEIELLDHLIIGEECYYSFRERQKLG